MTTLTLIYTSDNAGNFTSPKTGKRWYIQENEAFFRDIIAGKSIICGRKAFEADWRDLRGAKNITVIGVNGKTPKMGDFRGGESTVRFSASILGSLTCAVAMRARYSEEIFCVGGKQTIETFAPFASRLLLTHIGGRAVWLPQAIDFEVFKDGLYPDQEYSQNSLWANNRGGGNFDGYAETADKITNAYSRIDLRRNMPIEF